MENRSIKELRDRVGSVKNTKKITSAMKLVAAAKVCPHTLFFFVDLFLGPWKGDWEWGVMVGLAGGAAIHTAAIQSGAELPFEIPPPSLSFCTSLWPRASLFAGSCKFVRNRRVPI